MLDSVLIRVDSGGLTIRLIQKIASKKKPTHHRGLMPVQRETHIVNTRKATGTTQGKTPVQRETRIATGTILLYSGA